MTNSPPAAVQSEPGQPHSNTRRWRLSLRTVVFLLLALAFFVFIAGRFDFDASQVWTNIARSDPLFYGLGLGLYYLSFLIRGLRWRIILQSVGSPEGKGTSHPSTLECSQFILLARFADSVAWFRLGNVYRAYLVSDHSQASFPRTVGTLVAEHFLDALVVLVALLFLAFTVVGSVAPAAFLSATAAAFALTAALALGLILMRRFGPLLTRRLPPKP